MGAALFPCDVNFIVGLQEMEFKEFAQRPDAYAKICSMIGPSIYGHGDVKKAIACLLFGGSKKVFDLVSL